MKGMGFRCHSDIFLLERDQPAGYKSQHIDDGFEGSLRDRHEIFRNTTLMAGLEEMTDHIQSTNLGEHGRNRGAGYGEVEWRIPGRGSISTGLREWDESVAREAGRVRPYVQMTNLSNTGYDEILNVRMPGRSFVGGVGIAIAHKR